MPRKGARARVLITGASGFLGAHIAAAFGHGRFDVIAMLRHTSDVTRLQRLAGTGAALEYCDLTDAALGAHVRALAPDVIVHAAAYGVDYRQQDVAAAVAVNVEATVRLVQAAADQNVKRFIHIGTCYEYGDHPRLITADTCLKPQGIYGASKAAGSLLAKQCAAAAALPLVIVRPSSMYGPLEGPHKLVPQIIDACSNRQPLVLSPGGQIRDYVYVGDVARGCLQLATTDRFPGGAILNMAGGAPLTLRAFGDTIARLLDAGEDILRWGGRPYRPDEIMRLEMDGEQIRRVLGWRSETSLEDGLRSTINHELRAETAA